MMALWLSYNGGNCSGWKKLTVNAQVTRRKRNFMLNSD
jgi:hypothetical protein